MANPELPPAGDKRNLLEILKEILRKILGRKHEEKVAREMKDRQRKEREEEERERKNREERERREKEKRERVEREAKKEYHKRKSAQDRVKTEDLVKAREIIHQKQTEQIKDQVDKVISQPEPTEGEITSGYEEAYYLFSDQSRSDRNIREGLNRLIEESPKAAMAVSKLTEPGSKIHSDPTELLEAGKILYINTPADLQFAITDIIESIKQRVKYLVSENVKNIVQNVRRQGRQISEENASKSILEETAQKVDAYITEEQKNLLKDWNSYSEGVDQILSTPGPEGEVRPVDIKPPLPDTLPEAAVTNIDTVWEKVAQAQRAGKLLSVEELDDVRREVYAAESKSYPKDVFPGTEEYLREVSAIHKHTEERLNQLAEMARERIKLENPTIKSGITDPQEFLFQMSRRSGIFGDLLLQNEEMLKLFQGTDKKAYWFRNQIFLRIHGSVLTQKRESSSENFSLYERSDFTSFINFLRRGVSDIIVPETGKSVGQTWADWYTSLSTTIRLSRDIDYWVSQPAATIDNFNKSLALFQNEYSVQALTMPAVEQAYRAYETSLMNIRDTNDGYIPPALIEYDSAHNTIYWDQWAQDILLNKMIPQGVVRDSARDYERLGGLPKVNPDGITMAMGDKITEEDLKNDPEKLEIQMYMTLAKGFGMASMRFLEIVANSKVPNVEIPGFHSPVYEGAGLALNFWNFFIKKWNAGAYKYFYLMNTVLPSDKRLPIDSKGAERAYQAHLDGTFEKKYGKHAKRMMDIMNFDRASGAFSEFTPWRYFDDTIGWTDRQRQLMGGPTRAIFSQRLAEEKVREAVQYSKYKKEFAERLESLGRPSSGPDFEALWQNEGKQIYHDEISNDKWREMRHHDKKIEEEIENYRKAFTARVWVETAMRSPLTIAHNVEVDMTIPGYTGEKAKKRRKLHSYIVQQVLGITPEDLEYGIVEEDEGRYKVNAAKYASPTEEQRRKLKEILDLEGDLMSVREKSMAENRELKVEDFDIIKNEERKEHALKYWEIVRQFMIGTTDVEAYRKIYRDLGLEMQLDNYDIDWEKVNNINSYLKPFSEKKDKLLEGAVEKVPKAFDEDFVNKEWEWVIATDDTAFREMDLLNLGSRQWVRRGGDAAAHFQGSQLVASYFQDELTPNPDPHKLAEALMKIRQAYQGDDINVGYRVAGALMQMTSKMYEFDYKRLGSVAQHDIWKTRRNVAGWTANGRRAFFDAVEHMDVIPPHGHFEQFFQAHGSIRDTKHMNIHELRRLNRASDFDVWIEIITLGILMATALTLWRGLTAKSEEEEGGGGGHH